MSGVTSASIGLASIFAPYVAGTTAARSTGITDGASDLNAQYANIIYGTAAAATGINSQGVDLNTLFAKIGTTSYALPITGNTYSQAVNITSGSANATIGFRIVSGTTWQVYGHTSLNTTDTIYASGAVPSAAATVKYTWGTYTIGVGQSDAGGSITNSATTTVAVSVNPATSYTTGTNTSTSGSKDRQYPFTIDFFSSGGVNVSHTSITLIGDTEGSI